MGYKGWVRFGGVEVCNEGRAAALSRTLNINMVRRTPEETSWIEASSGETPHAAVEDAPWYDPYAPESAEFGGALPLDITGLGDSTFSSSPTEYLTDGGHPGKPRRKTQALVFRVALLGSTPRGVEYGRRWLENTLTDRGTDRFCNGTKMEFFSHERGERVHYNRARVTVGVTVQTSRDHPCASLRIVTFTVTAADPRVYGEPIPQITEMGGGVAPSGPRVVSYGTETTLTEASCTRFDYTPIYDPLYPALVPPPASPFLRPQGWFWANGKRYRRYWTKIDRVAPVGIDVVPIIKITSPESARFVRVSIWGASGSVTASPCDVKFSVILSYLPPNLPLYVDGEQRVAYTWPVGSPAVRRADTLVFTGDANPVEWRDFNDTGQMWVSLDIPYIWGTEYLQGSGAARVSLDFVRVYG